MVKDPYSADWHNNIEVILVIQQDVEGSWPFSQYWLRKELVEADFTFKGTLLSWSFPSSQVKNVTKAISSLL